MTTLAEIITAAVISLQFTGAIVTAIWVVMQVRSQTQHLADEINHLADNVSRLESTIVRIETRVIDHEVRIRLMETRTTD